MKTYDERMADILGKAKATKTAYRAIAASVTTLCILAIMVCSVIFWPELLLGSNKEPTMGPMLDNPFATQNDADVINPSNTSVTEPTKPNMMEPVVTDPLPSNTVGPEPTEPTQPPEPTTPPEPPEPPEPTEPDTPAEPIEVSSTVECFDIFDGIVFGPLMIRTYDELLALREECRPTSGIYQKLQQYDSTFFKENALVFVDYYDIVGGYDYRVKAVWKLPDGNIHVEIDKLYGFVFSEATSHDTVLIEINTAVTATAQVSVETTMMPKFWDSESPETCYPLIMVEYGQAYIMGAYASSRVYYSALDFWYDDKWLTDYYGSEEVAVTSPIINMEIPLYFQGIDGSFTANAIGMTVCGEYATGNYWVKLQLDCEIPNGLYFGTYSGLDIWTDEVTCGNQKIIVDMDSDGDPDTVKWAFEKSDGVYGCVFTVERDGQSTSFERWTEFFGYADVQVIPVDINGDGYMELIIYEYMHNNFGRGVSIYGLDVVGYIERLNYIISSIP